jgi:YD repeat-containing protein
MALTFLDDVVLLRTSDGRHVGLPRLAPAGSYFERSEKLTFTRDAQGYALRDRAGLTYRFALVGRHNGEHALVAIEDAFGQAVRLRHDAAGRLAQIVDTAGRAIDAVNDDGGRIVQLTAPDPNDAGRRFTVVTFRYDGAGNLASATDALGHAMTLAYQRHLLVRETNRNGLSFYFEFDGTDETARCVRTWGDGGIYDHKLTYAVPGVTVVENSLGHRTTYHHRDGLVIRRRSKMAIRSSISAGTGRLVGSPFYEAERQVLAATRTAVKHLPGD